MKKGFTLIEIITTVAIIAVLAIVVVLTLNPAEYFRQARDSNRVSDIDTLTHTLFLYESDQGTASGYTIGSSSVVYVSLPDPSISGANTSNCSSLSLPSLPSGYTYQCSSPQDYKNVNGTGWIPINFTAMTTRSPISVLPVDPTNTSSVGFYYTYNTDGVSQYEFTSIFESSKYKLQYGQNPIDPYYPEVDAKGNSLSLSPLFNPSGLTGWWPLTEGSGTVAYDLSGNGNKGTWSGSTVSGSHYTSGKVGTYAGNFDGTSDQINAGTSGLPGGSGPRSVFMWEYLNYNPSSTSVGLFTYGLGNSYNWSALYLNQGRLYFSGYNDDVGSNFFPSANAWHFVGYVYDGGTNITMYMDNQGSQTNAIPNQLNTTLTSSSIGGFSWGGNYFPGIINDVRIYNRTLSAAEVMALYNAEK